MGERLITRVVFGALSLAALLALPGCSGGTGGAARSLAAALSDLGLRSASYREAGATGEAIKLTGVTAMDPWDRQVSVDEVIATGFATSGDGWSARGIQATRLRAGSLSADTVAFASLSADGKSHRVTGSLNATGLRTEIRAVPVEARTFEVTLHADGGFGASFEGLTAADDTWDGRLNVASRDGGTAVAMGPARSGLGTFQADLDLGKATPMEVASYLVSPVAGMPAPGELMKANLRASLSGLPKWAGTPDPATFADARTRALAETVAAAVRAGRIIGDVMLLPMPGTRTADVASAAIRDDAHAALGIRVDPSSVHRDAAGRLSPAADAAGQVTPAKP